MRKLVNCLVVSLCRSQTVTTSQTMPLRACGQSFQSVVGRGRCGTHSLRAACWVMRALRRRVTAMSPREKHLALLSILALIIFVFYYIPILLYATLILVICCLACCYLSGEPLPARLGLDPRAGLNVPAVLRRWWSGWGATGVSVTARGRTKSIGRPGHREVEGHLRQRAGETGVYRREASASDSFLFSPRDLLMGSYIGKPESPAADSGRPRAGRNPREQLREKLSRPNHAVYTPNRRLTFTG